MTKKLNLIAICVTAACTAFGASDISKKISAEAQRCADATVNQDFATLSKYTHPKVVEMMGGEAGLIEKVKSGSEQMKAAGIRIARVDIGEAEEPKTIPGGMISLVPQTVTVAVPGGNVSQEGMILGVSVDKGETWVFIDLAAVSEPQFKQLFPDLAGHFVFPAKKQPSVEKTQQE